MSDSNPAPPQAAVVVERTYRATVEELWALWATKDGFESWWGPQGFRVEVKRLEAREGGAIEYDMIADSPEMIAAMKGMGRPVSTDTRGVFSEYRPHSRLTLVHTIDFVPNSPAYESLIEVDFSQQGDRARMVVTIHPHLDPHWTRMSVEGFNSQITKLDARFG